MTGKEFLKKRGYQRTVILITSLIDDEAAYIHADHGHQYKRGQEGMALMHCCGQWIESKTTNFQLENHPAIVSIDSIRAAVEEYRLASRRDRQYSLLGGKRSLNP